MSVQKAIDVVAKTFSSALNLNRLTDDPVTVGATAHGAGDAMPDRTRIVGGKVCVVPAVDSAVLEGRGM